MDDYYVGGPSHNGKRGRGTDKIKAVAAISRTEDGIPLFVRMKIVDDFKGKTLQQIIDQCFAEQAKVECDGYHSYRSLENIALILKPVKKLEQLFIAPKVRQVFMRRRSALCAMRVCEAHAFQIK